MTELTACPVCSAALDGVKTVHVRVSDRLVRCVDCGTVFATPQPSDEELQALYLTEYYNESNTRADADRKEEEQVARVLLKQGYNQIGKILSTSLIPTPQILETFSARA